MRLLETLPLMRVARPPAPQGARRLARCHSIEDVAVHARRRLPLGARGYLEGGGDNEYTLRRNRAAFDRFELLPDMPRDVSRVDTATTVLGRRIPLPIALSPVGAPRISTTRVSWPWRAQRAPPASRTGSRRWPRRRSRTSPAQTDAPLWFQLYAWGDRGEAREAVARARAAGCSALLFSIDTSVRSKREREKHAGLHLPQPHLRPRTLLDGALHPDWAWHFLTTDTISFPNIGPPDHRSREKIADMFDGTVRWEDLDWIRELWDGPILLKGVIRPEEVVRAADARAGLDESRSGRVHRAGGATCSPFGGSRRGCGLAAPGGLSTIASVVGRDD